MAQYDVVVVGLGAMGSAALHQLARRSVRAVGIERLTPGHDQGSSHGESRVIRLGYFEHPSYVPLLRRAYTLWRELEAASATKLLHITGIAEIGPPDGEVVSGTLAASRLHDLPHEVMDAAETMRRFPAFRIPADYVGVFQPDGGARASRGRGNPDEHRGSRGRTARQRGPRPDQPGRHRSAHGHCRRRTVDQTFASQFVSAAPHHPASHGVV